MRPRNPKIVRYIRGVLDKMKADGVISGYGIPKAVFASTGRFRMKVALMTHVDCQTKVDLTYTPMPDGFDMDGRLRFYTSDRMLVDRLLTFAARGELKDFHDISLLLEKVDAASSKEPARLADLVEEVIRRSSAKGILADFRAQMRATDLRFRLLRESGVDSFVTGTLRALRRFKNELARSRRRIFGRAGGGKRRLLRRPKPPSVVQRPPRVK